MNFIAHLLLSRDDEGLLIGNYIGDAIKGKSYLRYKKEIQRGIILHRQIDKFTDDHSSTIEIKRLFTLEYHKYSGVVVDLVYDYFLCKNWNKYSPNVSLQDFVNKSHKILLKNVTFMPPKMQRLLTMMIARKSLMSYGSEKGLKNTLDNMAEYKNLPNASNFAIATMLNNKDFINERFIVFFDEIIDFTEGFILGELS